jgi:hypothetical protein
LSGSYAQKRGQKMNKTQAKKYEAMKARAEKLKKKAQELEEQAYAYAYRCEKQEEQ